MPPGWEEVPAAVVGVGSGTHMVCVGKGGRGGRQRKRKKEIEK